MNFTYFVHFYKQFNRGMVLEFFEAHLFLDDEDNVSARRKQLVFFLPFRHGLDNLTYQKLLKCLKNTSLYGFIINIFPSPSNTAYSDITEGCVLFGPRNSRFFIFSDHLLTITHAMYLLSNKVASNQAKITVFLHVLYNYLHTCYHSSSKFELLKIVLPGRWK